jgi:hypothetical protein
MYEPFKIVACARPTADPRIMETVVVDEDRERRFYKQHEII